MADGWGQQREREPSVEILAASSWRTYAKTSVAEELNGLPGPEKKKWQVTHQLLK